MKKLLLSAIACVAFAGSSFASSEVINVQSETFFEYEYAVSNTESTQFTGNIDIKCYMRACMYVSGKKVCTEWVEISCDGADYSVEVEGDKKLDVSEKDLGIQQI